MCFFFKHLFISPGPYLYSLLHSWPAFLLLFIQDVVLCVVFWRQRRAKWQKHSRMSVKMCLVLPCRNLFWSDLSDYLNIICTRNCLHLSLIQVMAFWKRWLTTTHLFRHKNICAVMRKIHTFLNLKDVKKSHVNSSVLHENVFQTHTHLPYQWQPTTNFLTQPLFFFPEAYL